MDSKGVNGNLKLVLGYQPAFESYRLDADGHFELRSSVAPPLAYQLQSASNVASLSSNWRTVLATNLSTNYAYLYFLDTNVTAGWQRFYRIVPSP